MVELFNHINQNVKDTAAIIWDVASRISNPVKASEFLEHCTKYYSYLYTEEELQFLTFYINMKLEENKNASDINTER